MRPGSMPMWAWEHACSSSSKCRGGLRRHRPSRPKPESATWGSASSGGLRSRDPSPFRPSPQFTFGRSASAREKGIAEADAEFLIPIEVAWIAGPVALNADLGYKNAAGSEEIIYGLAVARGIPPSLELLGECHGSGDIDLTRQGVLCGLGFRWKVQQAISLMGAFAAAVAGSTEDRSDYRGYGGVQLRW